MEMKMKKNKKRDGNEDEEEEDDDDEGEETEKNGEVPFFLCSKKWILVINWINFWFQDIKRYSFCSINFEPINTFVFLFYSISKNNFYIAYDT